MTTNNEKNTKTIPVNPARPELRTILQRLEKSTNTLRFAFPVVTLSVFAGCLAAGLAASLKAGADIFPGVPAVMLGVMGMLPTLLISAAVAHLSGNILIKALSGLSHQERRCLALHLPYNRAPERWPGMMVKWIYGGDWLVEPKQNRIMPYIRAFVTGAIPGTIEAELNIWAELMHRTTCSGNVEAGRCIRDLACVQELPTWTREIDSGSTLPELESKLGKTATHWATTLLKRAAQRLPALEGAEFAPHSAEFEFQHCNLHEGRECLLVIIRPGKQEEDTREEAESAAA